MSTVRELHDIAMALASIAEVAKYEKSLEWLLEAVLRQAMKLEAQAADLIPSDKDSEPSRSILYRSAASLAIQCKEFDTAQYLISKGLAGFPPPRIEAELRELSEQVIATKKVQP